MSKINCNIAVPLYKNIELLSPSELFSLKNNITILRNWPHVLIGPPHIDWHGYKKLFSELGIQFKIEIFSEQFFNSVSGYNTLLTSLKFYQRFSKIKFILICQLDSFVFRDELKFWCNKGYDYIGAPWFEGLNLPTSDTIVGVGNGGFSLRNVSNSICVLNRIMFLKILRKFWFKSRLQAIWRFQNIVLSFRRYFHIRSMEEINTLLLQNNSMQEDFYWTHVGGTFNDYKVATIEDAIKFSFEVNPTFLYKKNHKQLPFGCHAWEKYEPEFWNEFINVEMKLEQKNA